MLELSLVLEQPVVHIPEAALLAGGLGGLRGGRRMGVDVGQGEVTEHEPKAAAEPTLELLQHGVGRAAVRTLEVAVLDERHAGAVGARGHGPAWGRRADRDWRARPRS